MANKKTKEEPGQFKVDKRLMKIGGSLVVGVPNEAIKQWNLGKGDEVRISILDGAVRIEPKQPTKVANISQEAAAAYSRTMKGIQAKVTMDTENSALHLEFTSENQETLNTFIYNLWRNLPVFLSMLGIGSVEKETK